jgi:hypothetical protein
MTLPEYPEQAECTLEKGLSALEHAAAELGAKSVTVLVAEGSAMEIVYPQTRAIEFQPELANGTGPVRAGASLAGYLASTVAPPAKSFFLFPWCWRRRTVTIVFGFNGPEPAHASIPARVAVNLNLAALAAWSVKEACRLRGELRVVNHQLANRKFVERAKSILQDELGVTEPEAYECLRRMSRQRRVTLTKLAEELVEARSFAAATLESSAPKIAP